MVLSIKDVIESTIEKINSTLIYSELKLKRMLAGIEIANSAMCAITVFLKGVVSPIKKSCLVIKISFVFR